MNDSPSIPSCRLESPTSSERAAARIKAFAQFRGWRRSRLAREAGISPNTLKNFDRDDWNPTLKTMKSLEAIIPESFSPEGPTKTA